MNEKLNALFQNEELVNELFSQETAADAVAFLAKHDISVTEEEISMIQKELKKQINSDTALSEDDLDSVAGGFAYIDASSILKQFSTISIKDMNAVVPVPISTTTCRW